MSKKKKKKLEEGGIVNKPILPYFDDTPEVIIPLQKGGIVSKEFADSLKRGHDNELPQGVINRIRDGFIVAEIKGGLDEGWGHIFANKKIIIFGGTGTIGSLIVDYLRKQSPKVKSRIRGNI